MSEEVFDLLYKLQRNSLESVGTLPWQKEAEKTWIGLMIKISGSTYVIRLSEVVEVLKHLVITDIPGTAGWILGITNYHGDLLTIMDLKYLLGDGETIINKLTRIVVVNYKGKSYGFLLEEITGLYKVFDKNSIDSMEENNLPNYVTGRYAINGNTCNVFSLMSVLESKKFFRVTE